MTAMRLWCFAVAFSLALAACDREPTFDAASLANYHRSLSAITARLRLEEQRRLQLALMTLAAGDAADYTAFALAHPETITNLEQLDGVGSAQVFFDRIRARIDGRTATGVIRGVADDLEYAISRAETRNGGSVKELATFVIENPRYFWDRNKLYANPTIEFSIYNGSKGAISRVLVSGEVVTRAIPTPWVLRGVGYRFARPLEPGAQQKATIILSRPGDWTSQRLESAYDAELKLKVSNTYDASGRVLLAVSADALDAMRRKLQVLLGS